MNDTIMFILKILFWVSIAVVFYTYIGYGILLWILVKIKSLAHKDKVIVEDNVTPDVTLLIAAYNEEDVVDEKMQNTLALNYPSKHFNIVWITDGSNDATNEKLSAYQQVTILHQPQRQGKTAAINRGMPFIHTPIVIFTDANTMINKDAINEIVSCFSNPNVGCVAGEKRIAIQQKDNAAAGGEGIYWKYESALKSLDSQLCTAIGAAGELFAIRRELFETMENDTLLDDFILSMRIAQRGYKIAYCAKAYAIENGSADMNEEKKRKVRIAAGGIQSIYRLRALLNIFKYGIMSFQYISHRVLRWSITPVLLFLLIPLNIAIVTISPQNTTYIVILILQAIFYAMGYWGYYLSKKSIKNKILYIPYYFIFMNTNVISGFFYLRRKKGSGAWEKAKRA
ncbi:MAG: glycosyltransferase family 2 protein [Muribaculaceae bacterium]